MNARLLHRQLGFDLRLLGRQGADFPFVEGPFGVLTKLLLNLVALLEQWLHHRALLLHDGFNLLMLRVGQIQRAWKKSHPVPMHAVLVSVHMRRRRRVRRGLRPADRGSQQNGQRGNEQANANRFHCV